MFVQSVSLIVCLFLTQVVADTGVQFVMDRNPNNYFCGHLQCVANIHDSANEVASFVDMAIYDITRVNSELNVASVSIFQPDLYVDTTKSSALSCTGVMSKHQANLTVQLRHDIDCLYGVFKCQLRLITMSGNPSVVQEIITPKKNNINYSRIEDVATRVDRLVVMLDEQSDRVNTQTAEIKRLADIVDQSVCVNTTAEIKRPADIADQSPNVNTTAETKRPADIVDQSLNVNTTAEIERLGDIADQSLNVNTQTAEIKRLAYIADQSYHVNTTDETKRLADIMEIKILPLIEETAQIIAKPSTPSAESVPASCNNGWVEFDKFCFFFSEKTETWDMASAVCQEYGGQLVEIESQEKQDWMAEQMKTIGIGVAWIGGTKQNSIDWIWVTSYKPITKYTNWAPNQPDLYYEKCIHIRADYEYKWNDIPCWYDYPFVCERRLIQ